MPQRPISDDDRDDLTAYLDGEADNVARARVEARLNSDPTLRAEADSLKKVWEMLDHLPRTEPNPTFTTKTLDKLAALRPVTASLSQPVPARVGQRGPWAWAAIIVLGFVVGWGLLGGGRQRGPRPLRVDDPVLVRDLRLIENLPLYHSVESMEFLQLLDQPDKFGSDATGP